jgi:hypothetical protein
MRRREFISLLSGVVLWWPRGVVAQRAAKRPLVAVLLGSSSIAAARYVSGFSQGLQELGYVEGGHGGYTTMLLGAARYLAEDHTIACGGW